MSCYIDRQTTEHARHLDSEARIEAEYERIGDLASLYFIELLEGVTGRDWSEIGWDMARISLGLDRPSRSSQMLRGAVEALRPEVA